MASVNRVILVGNLGADPEIRNLPSGDVVANIRLATTDRYKEKASGEMVTNTEWHRVSFFGRLAEIVAEFLKKGSAVYIEGRLRTRKWQVDGVDRYSTEIVAESMQMIGGRKGDTDTGKPRESHESPNQAPADYFRASRGGSAAGSTTAGRARATPTRRNNAAPAADSDFHDDDLNF